MKSSVKIGSKVDVLPNSKDIPIFTGHVVRFDPSKLFVYIKGRFNTESYPKIKSTTFQEINVSLENVRLVKELSSV